MDDRPSSILAFTHPSIPDRVQNRGRRLWLTNLCMIPRSPPYAPPPIGSDSCALSPVALTAAIPDVLLLFALARSALFQQVAGVLV